MEIIAMVNRLGIKGLLAASMGIALSFSAFAAGPQGIATSSNFNVSALEAGARYDGFIVTYRDGTTERVSAAAATQNVSAAMSRAKLAGIAAGTATGSNAKIAGVLRVSHVRKLAIGAELMHTSRMLSSTEAEALIRQIAADPAVAYVAPDVMRQAVRDIRADAVTPFVPNDTYYARYQWHLRAPDGTLETDSALHSTVANRGGSNVAQAWTLADGTGIMVAVLDTGITVHPDLDTSLADAGYDFITNAFTSGRTTDGRVPGGWDTGDWTTTPAYASCVDATHPAHGSSWHGTQVSGTVAELTNNTIGMAGVASKAKVLPVRVLGHCGGFDSDIADAIIWAAGGSVSGVPANTHPAQVINMSLGGGGICTASDVTAKAIAQANALGAVVVVAAGNDSEDTANHSPASCPGAVTIASVGITSKKAYYSNYGTRVDIAAPGGGVFVNDASSGATVNTGFIWQAINGGATVPANPSYTGFAGTSQATPHVSGTIALMQSARLASFQALLSPADVLTMLKNTAHAPVIAPNQEIGAGIVDAYAAVTAAVNNDLDRSDTITLLENGVAATGRSGGAGDVLQYKIDVPAGARALALRTFGGGGDVSLYVKSGAAASATSFDKSSVHANSNNESVSIARPATATYYVSVVGVTDFTSLTVQANYAR
jgi:serine protease